MLNILQTPTELLDRTIDWSTRGLGTDTISTSAWTVTPTGPTMNNLSNDATTTTMWLTGGVAGTVYKITNTIVTTGGRTMQETISFLCLANRQI